MRINPVYFTKEAFSSFRHNLVQSVAAITTVALCLMVVGLIMLVLFVGGELIKNIENKVEIEVYLEGPEVTAAAANVGSFELEENLGATIQSWSEVKNVDYISKDQALKDFRETFKDRPEVLAEITENPLPASYRVSLKNPREVEEIAGRIKGLPNIQGIVGDTEQNIKYGRDMVKNLFAATRWMSMAAGGFAVLLIFVSLVLITNTIRLAIFARRKEIGIMRLVGASSWFIRWPFVLEGILAGVLGAGIAAMALSALWQTFKSNMESGNMLTFLAFPVDSVPFAQLILVLFASGAAIGALGSMIALRRFLKI